MYFKFLFISLVILKIICIQALDNGLARTPPMGWMHALRFGCIKDCETYPDECTSEKLFKRHADLLVSEGYAEVGYEYVIIDNCLMEKGRDNVTQKLVPDKDRFPNGLNHLADYIHNKGLKFGLFHETAEDIWGSVNHMELDAQTFADWDVDYVKLTGWWHSAVSMDISYPLFGSYLNKTGRPMVFSCSWAVNEEKIGTIPNYEALKKTCNLWRNWYDIQDSYESITQIMDYFSNNQTRIQPHGGPGHWNDPDTLILGNYGLSLDQSKQQMAVWAILAAPLIMSNDLATVRPEIKEILQNRDIIAINQDPLGIQGRRLLIKDGIEVWIRPVTPLSNKGDYSYAVAFVSRRADGAPYTIKFGLKELELNAVQTYEVMDLFDGYIEGEFNSTYVFESVINPNGVNFYKFEVDLC